MTRVVRKGMFETNSSSTHSIIIEPLANDDSKRDSLNVDSDGVCRIYGGEFGWGYEKYYDAATKASYLMTSIMQHADTDEKIEAAENCDRALMLKEVIKVETGAKEVRFCKDESDYAYYPYGYIDHQSGEVPDEAFVSVEAVRDFIFNPESLLEIDNDNH